jgi:lipid II:glycine glycyltransferase (peptidoglycan interpeptide bridge formation enzyme)
MWGVFRFKEGFGGQVIVTLGAWDYPPSALWYALYVRMAAWFSAWARSQGRRSAQQMLRE